MTDLPRLQNFVNGVSVDPVDGAYSPVVNPSTGEAFAEAPVSSAKDVDLAFAAARSAFENTWGTVTPAERQKALLGIADSLEAHSDELARLESQNTGKTVEGAAGELEAAIDQMRFFAGAARVLEGRAGATYLSGTVSTLRREPIGVVGQVTPWNYPILMAAWKIAPALAAGNTIVLKPSDTTPVTTLRIAQLASEHLPAGTFNVITGDRDTGRALVEHPAPQMIAITGSTRAGSQVAASAAKDVKRLHLELGGKAPVIVFADADVDEAIERISAAGFYNAGQDCTAATRVLVAAEIYPDFVEKIGARIGKLVAGDPADPAAHFGPLNNPTQLAHVSGIVDRIPAHAKVVTGGRPADGPGYFYEPTVICDLRQEDEAVQAEIFGPVVTVQSFSDEAEAVRMANGVPYGLASSVWTRDHARALRVAGQLDFGTVWVNIHRGLVAEMPHGGYKQSGYGNDLSIYSMEEYTRIKHVLSNLEG